MSTVDRNRKNEENSRRESLEERLERVGQTDVFHSIVETCFEWELALKRLKALERKLRNTAKTAGWSEVATLFEGFQYCRPSGWTQEDSLYALGPVLKEENLKAPAGEPDQLHSDYGGDEARGE